MSSATWGSFRRERGKEGKKKGGKEGKRERGKEGKRERGKEWKKEKDRQTDIKIVLLLFVFHVWCFCWLVFLKSSERGKFCHPFQLAPALFGWLHIHSLNKENDVFFLLMFTSFWCLLPYDVYFLMMFTTPRWCLVNPNRGSPWLWLFFFQFLLIISAIVLNDVADDEANILQMHILVLKVLLIFVT